MEGEMESTMKAALPLLPLLLPEVPFHEWDWKISASSAKFFYIHLFIQFSACIWRVR